jgi:type II secretory pathway pseudopilin PulG
MRTPFPFTSDKRKEKRRGQLAVELLFLAAIVITLIGGFVSLAASFLNLSVRAQNEAQAFAIAEAGIEYYKWHLAYSPQDFMDGTGGPGPYVHAYYNKNGVAIGKFSLSITPPVSGSTIVTITSTGTVNADGSIKKVIKVQLGVPSFAQYAWVMNSVSSFGSTAQVYGIIYSNNGIHFDGVAHNLVESALTTYNDPTNGNRNEWAVYTDGPPADPQPPTAYGAQANVFLAGRETGVPAIDFAGITSDLATIKAQAQASGTYFGSSGALGYDLVLSTTTYTVYTVTALVSPQRRCTNAANETGWGTWSIQTEALYASGTIPQNGDMFFEDNLWVRGSVKGVRVTIASGRFPVNQSTYSDITVNNSITYSNFNGSDTIALIAQNNINIGLNSDNDLTIDAALIAQNGGIQRYYYSSSCGTDYLRNNLTTLGIMGTNQPSGLVWEDQYGNPVSGYETRTYNYDANLLYSPPPSFPLTTNGYVLISWKELQ